MSKVILPFVILFGLLVGAMWLDDPQEPADIVFVNRGELHTLDPQKMSWLQDFRIAYAIYEGLVRWDNDTFSVEPATASRWSVSEDGRKYTFSLRPEAKWSNGDQVTAEDYVYSWRRALLPDTAADYSDLFFRLKGGEAFFEWRIAQLNEYAERPEAERTVEAAAQLRDEAFAKFDSIVGVQAIDPFTLQVELERPTPYMLDLLAFPVFYPVHPPTVEQYLTLDAASGSLQQQFGWTKPGKLVSNGPYVLAVWRYMRDLRLQRNPFYWNPDLAQADSVASLAIDDPNTSVLAFSTGTIDWLSTVAGIDYLPDMIEQARRYRERHAEALEEHRQAYLSDVREAMGDAAFEAKFANRLQDPWLGYGEAMARLAQEHPPGPGERNDIHAFPAYGTYFYNFNCQERLNDGRPNPFHDPRVRRAFTMAVDKELIVTSVTRMNQPVATTFIPPNSIPGFTSPAGLAHDPAAARQLMTEAGWVDRDRDGTVEDEQGQAFPRVEILYETNGGHEEIALAVADMWQRELGVEVVLEGQESKTAGERKKNHDFMISRANWFGDYGDPTTYLDIFRTNNGNNDRAYSNPEFDALMQRADREPDSEARMRLLEEAEAMVMNEALPMLPLFHRVTVYMYRPEDLRGLTTHSRLVQYLWELAPRTSDEAALEATRALENAS
ncbi:MAG: peptide ABC transporter substrate-binding protein [Planctomycetota bacterium]